MRKAGLILLAGWVCWAGLAAGAAAAPPDVTFYVQELGIPEGYDLPRPYGMNNLGDVVGTARRPTSGHEQMRAILWDKDKTEGVLLPLPAECNESYDSSYVYAINDAGQAVGYASRLYGGDVYYIPCLWGKGTVQALQNPPDSKNTKAFGINNLGQIVGGGYGGILLWENAQSPPLSFMCR